MSAIEIGSVEREKGRNEGRFGASGPLKCGDIRRILAKLNVEDEVSG